MKPYQVKLEISGPVALWARPDTLPNPVSYVAPTFSAAKGIFEAILRWKTVNVRPTRCEICAPVQFHRYAFNYGGPLRKSSQIKNGASLQIFAQVLVNVCYRLYGEAGWNRSPNGDRVVTALRTPMWTPSTDDWNADNGSTRLAWDGRNSSRTM